MHRKRNTLFLALTPIAFIAIVWILNSGPEIQTPPTQTGQLASGSTVAIKKITYGKKHQCFPDSPGLFQRIIRGLPISYQKKLGYQQPAFQFESANGQDTLGLWLTTPVPVIGLRLVTVNSNGHETINFNFQTAIIFQGSQKQGLSGWHLKNFPRREKQFTVRLEERQTNNNNTWKPVIEWQISNPGAKSYPTWTASPLPITREKDGVKIALTKLITYIGTNGPTTRASFQVTTNSQPVPNWLVKKIKFTDATGNELWSGSVHTKSHNGEITYECNGRLDPHESAWKLSADFETYNYRPQENSAAKFVPDQLSLDFIASPVEISTP
jgi:hypothetical protein